jgi:hypothetical protein
MGGLGLWRREEGVQVGRGVYPVEKNMCAVKISREKRKKGIKEEKKKKKRKDRRVL